MTRHIHIHRILIQAEKEDFLEEVAFELGLAELREWGSMRNRGRRSWLLVHTSRGGMRDETEGD